MNSPVVAIDPSPQISARDVMIGEPFNPHRRFHGIFVPLGLLRCRDISDGSKLLYGRLCLFAGKDGECFADRTELAKEMGLSVSTIGRQLEELVAAKFIKRVRRSRGQTALCQFLWHPALESCQRSAPDSAILRVQRSIPEGAKVRCQGSSEGAEVSHQEQVQTAQECAPDSAILRHAIKEEKIPLKDSLTPGRVHELPLRRDPLVFSRPQTLDWPSSGWENSEDFEGWWMRVVERHPNRKGNAVAKSKAVELVMAGQFKRADFERGYAAFVASKAGVWSEAGGRYVENLYTILVDQLWKFKPCSMPAASEIPSAEDYLRRVENE